ncbi:hypothetical protein [Pseudonocardia hierapolitana]|uniref:hypothetical protein n=1 Tax=Pseudonocardia hierapolitana TaxID=1128676 RepID=UPI001BAFECFD|nr:hypothetical protein [Pseudonocardia hierapolitana]
MAHEGVGETDRSWAEPLPPSVGSLARGIWSTTAGTLIAKSVDGGIRHLVGRVRARLSRAGVAGLTREEVSGPVGNALNHNLITELVRSTTLVPPDLRRLELPG